jgi:glycosyltransferase involved in cell wall biosynthesis
VKKIKIAHLIDFLGPGGVQEILKHIVRRSPSDMEHHIIVLRRYKPYYEKDIVNAGGIVHYLHGDDMIGLYLFAPIIIFRLHKILTTSHFDALHIHLPGSMIVGAAGSLGVKIKRILSIYAWKAQVPRWVYPVSRVLNPLFDRVTWVDDIEMPWVRKEQFVRISHGVEPPEETSALNRMEVLKEFGLKDGEGPCLFSVARLHPDKRHDDAIRAFAVIRDRLPSAVLFVVGEGSTHERAKLVRLAGQVGERGIRFTGHRFDLSRLFSIGGFFLRTSANECVNLSTILASFAGLITIGYDMQGIVPFRNEIIRPGITGGIVPLKDYEAMAAEVIRIWEDPAVFAQFSAASAAYARETRNIMATILNPYYSVYRSYSS